MDVDLMTPAETDTARLDRPRWRRVAAWVTTTLAALLVLFALIAPNDIGHLTPGAFLRLPVEGLVGMALFLVLPARGRRWVAAVTGVVLGVLTIFKLADTGFYAVLNRPFDPVLDWSFLGNAVDFLRLSIGRFGAFAAVVVAAVLAVAVLVFMALAMLRLSRLVVRHRTASTRGITVLGVAWIICAVLGVQVVAGVPVASRSAATATYDRARQVGAGIRDHQKFADESAVDAFRDTPADKLLTGLRGKDVILAFVESYGRSAVEDPQLAPQVDAVLDDGTRRLRAAGFASRSAWLTSPTFGGGSWLAHATLNSGLWINNQQRYRTLVQSDRLTLTSAFKRADWHTVALMPATTGPWPEKDFYRFDRVYDSTNMGGYSGPRFTFSAIPDQYTLATFERSEHSPANRAPVMAEIPLLCSHGPWAPIPRMLDWNDLGDGSVFAGVVKDAPGPDPGKVRVQYRQSIEYSLSSLISYIEKYGNDNTVVVFLGDHQPATLVTGQRASHDVPITILARDPAVLDRIAGWGWQDGLRPGPQAPVWKMSAFRDRFLTAYSDQ
jgi:hypothetical protein